MASYECFSQIKLGDITFGNKNRLVLLAGPCQLESRQHAFEMAGILKEITEEFSVSFVYKTSFDKANRSSFSGARGVGLEKALPIFADLKQEYGIAIMTDVHLPEQCDQVGNIVDILQIPAFLCRQTDLLVSAAKTGKVINVKKGQFLAPWEMGNIVEKILAAGNRQIMLCERGSSFGYNRLVNDMRSLPIMAGLGTPVIYDASHSVQEPGALGDSSGGQREFVADLARAAVAVGVAGLFLEVHDDPDNAPSDGANMIKPKALRELLDSVLAIDQIVKKY